MATDDQWMSEEELSALTGLSVKRLQNLRSERRLFPFSNPPGTNVNVYEREAIHKIFKESQVEVQR